MPAVASLLVTWKMEAESLILSGRVPVLYPGVEDRVLVVGVGGHGHAADRKG